MAKRNNIQQYRSQLHTQLNFSFSQPPPTPIPTHTSLNSVVVTPSECRAMGMWINTVMELHSQQFLHALKHCRKLSVGDFNLYLLRHYHHLKGIIRYYIIASLIDYQHCRGKEGEGIQSECVFLNIVIQELTSRFFRESQWFHKISHLPLYIIYNIFDPYLKGYTTVGQIRRISQGRLLACQAKINKSQNDRKKKKLEKMLHNKLSNNLQGNDPRIYQQNLGQLMLRVNLIVFQQIFTNQSLKGGSQRYHLIDRTVKEYQQITSERNLKLGNQQLARSRKDQEELNLMRQDYQIKQHSVAMGRKEYSCQIHHMTLKKDWKSTGFQEAYLSTPPLTINKPQDIISYPFSERNHKDQKSPQHYPTTTFNPTSSRKQNSPLNFQPDSRPRPLHDKLVLRNIIMCQLSVIKQQKRKTHLHYLQYL